MQHPYLKLTNSDTYQGKYVVGKTARATPHGDGLTNTSVKVVEIPSIFNGIEIAEIGHLSFYRLEITSIFIPKTVLRICQEAFNWCKKLTDVRFEEGSKLEILEYMVFYCCTSLKKIDFPASITSIIVYSGNKLFGCVSLDCFSYSGTHDFSSLSYFFDSVTNIYVSNSYQGSEFAGLQITEKGKTCGVSKEHLEMTPKRTRARKCSVAIKRINVPFQQYMFLLIQS